MSLAVVRYLEMSIGAGPERPKWVMRVSLVKDLMCLPVEATTERVAGHAMPESSVIHRLESATMRGTSAGRISLVMEWPRDFAILYP